MDTPGFRDGGNYTGHALKPPSPIYDPQRVAQAMVNCAIKPRASTTVGAAAHAARLSHFLVPGFTRLVGWFTRRGIRKSPASAPSSGNLFAPPSGTRRVEGEWREESAKPSTVVALASTLLIGGCMYAFLRNKRS